MATDCKSDQRINQIREEYRFSLMLFLLICLMILEPLVYDFLGIKILLNLIFSAIMLSSIYAVSYKKYATLIAVVLALPLLIISWSSTFVDLPWHQYGKDFFGILFFLFVIIIIVKHIFRQDEVSREILFAAIVVFMLLGLMWSFIFQLIEIFHSDSFNLPQGQDADFHGIFLYYSFVTLTTLGYGDITPITAPARSLSLLEAIAGQMYVAVLIARLMGIHISQSMRKKPG
jgi:voltage-gated potassium channel